MRPCEIKKGIYWVGAVDWGMRTFHGYTYTTRRGTTYNAYLIIDDKIALVDAVYGPFADEMLERISGVVLPERIDYIIVNHIETDHAGALPAVLKLCPKAKVFGTAKCKEGLLRHYHVDMDFQVVKTGDKIRLGKKTLSFIEAAMIHWPDSMFTYCPEEELLLPNDAFGQHYATSKRFDDEVDGCELQDETAKYYANILMPFGGIILRKLEELQNMNIPINMIAPSHGVIWRKDPAGVVRSYMSWARNETRQKAVIVYETMWGATERMARRIAEGIIDAGVEVRVFDIAKSDRTDVVKELLDAKGYLVGSSTHDNAALPSITAFLGFLKGLRPKSRIGCAFGSYGWAGGGVKSIENILKETGIELVQPSFSVHYLPDKDELNRCYEYGKDFANKLKKGE